MNVVILGTGSTIGTLQSITPDSDLGVNSFTKRLSQQRPGWRDQFPRLAVAIDECGFENLDQIWTHIDYRAKFERALRKRPYDAPRANSTRRS